MKNISQQRDGSRLRDLKLPWIYYSKRNCALTSALTSAFTNLLFYYIENKTGLHTANIFFDIYLLFICNRRRINHENIAIYLRAS